MNNIEEVWNRIIKHCSLKIGKPMFTFKTKNDKDFYIVNVNNKTIRVYLFESNNKEWTISRKRIENDLKASHPRENELVKDYPSTAQSYRYGLLHDERIYKRK